MVPLTHSRGARLSVLLALSCLGLAVAGCGSSSPSTSSGSSTGTKVTGTASIAYASSLQYLNDHTAGPAFASATGDKYSGQGNSSGTLESEIAAGEIMPNVFESVGGDNITPLEPKFTKWYVQYAGTSMVVAYNPHSKYAPQFKAIADGKKPLKDLFPLLETKGLKLGRTDPNSDPQGRDFIYMLELAQKTYHLPADTVTKILGGPAGSATLAGDLRRVLAGLDAAVRSARRGQRVRHPGRSSCTWPTSRCRPTINLGDRRRRRSVRTRRRSRSRRRAAHDGQDRLAAGDRHHHPRQAHSGRDRVRQVHAVLRLAWRSTSRAVSPCSRPR